MKKVEADKLKRAATELERESAALRALGEGATIEDVDRVFFAGQRRASALAARVLAKKRR